MPQLGLTMTEGAVTTWLKNPGDRVEKGDLIFTVQTDKVEMEVESFGRGYLDRILVAPEQVVPVGTVIATLSDYAPGDPSAEAAAAVASGPPVSPRARRVAQELSVDLTAVKPANGKRITEDDVRLYYQAKNGASSAPPAAEPPPKAAAAAIAPAPGKPASLPAARKITAERMASSFQSAPHFYLGVEANAVALVSLRESLVSHATDRFGVKLTYTDFFLKAIAVTLTEQPHVNESWSDGSIVRRESIDVGFAAQTDNGLVVPVVRKADRLSIFDLGRERASLTTKAREGKLSLADMEGGSATLSNLGHLGIDWFQAILNPPQSVILATGRIAKRPVVVNDVIQALPTVMLNLSADHRVLDGVAAAVFLARVRELIEAPALLLI
jgi:pyruvate dehydrogenase E2 component (dihydrolipoamide acetyltransferase)